MEMFYQLNKQVPSFGEDIGRADIGSLLVIGYHHFLKFTNAIAISFNLDE